MAMKKHGVGTGKSKLQSDKDAGRYSDIKKKLFNHNADLDKQKVTQAVTVVKPDSGHYNVNKAELEEFMPVEKRTSKYWQPDENVYDAQLLQKLIRNINSIARFVVGRPVGVSFSETGAPVDNYSGDKLVVSLGALLDHRIPFHMRLNVTTALAINKAFGAKYTTPGVERLLVANGFTKNKIAKFGLGKTQRIADFDQVDKIFTHGFQKYLLNACEDRRIESLGMEKYSGYVYYFEEMRKYAYWCHLNYLAYPNPKPNWSDPNEFYKGLTMYISYKNLMPEILPEFKAFGPNDAKFKQLTDQVDAILAVPAKTFDDCMEQSRKLLELYPKEQRDQQEKNCGGGKAGKGKPGPQIMEGTPADGKKTKLDKDAKDTIEDVIDDEQEDATSEDHEIDLSDRMTRTDDYEKVHVQPAEEGRFDATIYKEASEIAKQIAKNLSFLDSRFNRTQQMWEMRSGELDEDAIYGLKYNKDIFWEEEEAPGYSMDFAILVDESGSMGGQKIRSAQIAALALALALKDNTHINLFVYGHTANNGSYPITMYRYFDPMEKGTQNINTMFSIHARSNNADGYAIAHMGDVLQKGTAKQKVLVVCSDGYPSASGYGGTPGIKHTQKMVQKLETAGVFVVQIALEDLNSAAMFTHYIPYDKNSLGINLKKVLCKKLVEISNSI
jgi:hypothetical protein